MKINLLILKKFQSNMKRINPKVYLWASPLFCIDPERSHYHYQFIKNDNKRNYIFSAFKFFLRSSLSGLKKVNILSFWYGFKKDITNGKEINKIKEEQMKYFALTPDNHKTTKPLKPIKIEVPKSG